jgi:hypothetical protein
MAFLVAFTAIQGKEPPSQDKEEWLRHQAVPPRISLIALQEEESSSWSGERQLAFLLKPKQMEDYPSCSTLVPA